MMFFGSSARLMVRIMSTAPAPVSVDQELHLVQADAVLAGAGAFQAQGARHQLVVELLGDLALLAACPGSSR